MPGDKVKASAIYAEAFRLEGEVKRLQEALGAANAELAVWRDEDGREAKYEHVSQRCTRAESERDALRTALTDIVTLCMDVPATEDWRAKVGDKARRALHGEPGWKQT